MIVTYTALRSLYGNHVAGQQYALTIATTIRLRSRRVTREQQRSLSGKTETLYYYADRAWSVTFEPVRGDRILQLQEMLDSTESGEQFSMTLLGETQPAIGVKRTDEGYQFAPFMEVGDLVNSDWVQAGIEVVQA